MTDKDKSLENVNEALKELRETVEESKLDGLDQGKVDKINKFLDEQEDLNQKASQAQKLAEKEADELKERLDIIEKEASRPGNAETKQKKLDEHNEAFNKWYVGDGTEQNIIMSADELKYLRSDVDTDGGFLTSTDMVKEIIKGITEVSPIRSIARIRTTGKGKVSLPARTSLLTAEWEGEGETGTDSTTTYGLEELPIHKLNVTVPITIEELMDADFSLESEINSDVAEAFGQKEGTAFVIGDADKRPEGFMTNTDISERNSGIADKITMDSIILLAGDLKTGYNPVYGMNRSTIATVRTLKDGAGQYLWIAGNVVAGLPNQINGHVYIEMPDLANIGTNTFPVVFGDFKKGYLIGDRMQLNVIRDPFALKKSGKVEFTYTRRVGGQVILPEAIKKLKIAV